VFLNEFAVFSKRIISHCSNYNATLIVMGDFNINLLAVDTCTSSKNFMNIIYPNGMFPTIFLPTRITKYSATLIDNCFTNNPPLTSLGVIHSDISDHLPIFVAFPVCNTNFVGELPTVCYQHVSDSLTTKIANHLTNQSWDYITDFTNIDSDYNSVINSIQTSVIQFVSFKATASKPNKKSKPWLTAGLLQSIKTKHKLYIKAIVHSIYSCWINLSKPTLKINSKDITVVDKVKILGVTIISTFSWITHAD
jgi:hypothetical protein